MAKLEKLFQPIKVGQIELKNRLVMLATITNYDTDGLFNERVKAFYLERAKGGVGLISFGCMSPTNLQGGEAFGVALYKDEFIPKLHQFTQEVHSQGAKVLAQLNLRYQWRKSEDSPLETVGPTGGIITGPGIQAPRELALAEIEQIVKEFGEAARRAREASFDGIELMAADGYLINRFMSPCSNKRSDKYGGSLKNRLRFLQEIIENIKEKAGQDYTLFCRFPGDEFMEGGHGLEDSKQVAGILQQAGINCLNVYAGWHECPQPLVQASVPQGAYVYLAEEIKKVVQIPVIAGVRIKDPVFADQVLVQGKADLVGMCRALIADPDLPRKAEEERFADIRPCTACTHCLSKAFRNEEMECSVNPRVGRETEPIMEPAAEPKQVFIIGGGPAGMEAATTAARRGHQVTLFEKKSKLGGQLKVASVPPYKNDLEDFTRYLIDQVKKAGVKVELGTEVTPQFVLENKPDVVIVATGAVPSLSDVPGTQGDNVVTPIDVLSGNVEVGQRVLVVGGGFIGCEAAEFLAQKGKKVIITSRQQRMGHNLEPTNRWVVMQRLRKASVATEPRTQLKEITDKGIWVERDGESAFLEGDTIVLAAGMISNRELLQQLEGKVASLYSIGDCTEPGKILEAIHAGYSVGARV